jgi:hypothetical protein
VINIPTSEFHVSLVPLSPHHHPVITFFQQNKEVMSCPDCITGANLPGTPKGVLKDDGSYFAAAPEGGNSEHKRAVILLTDVFGLGLDNPKIMADYFAEQLQCDVWVPDIFAGE